MPLPKPKDGEKRNDFVSRGMTERRQTWFSTGILKAGGLRVDRAAHALCGVTLANVGEAKGHDLWLDGIFLDPIIIHQAVMESRSGPRRQSGASC